MAAFACFGEIAIETLKMTLVDHRGVLRVVQDSGIHLGDRFLRGGDNFMQFLFGNQKVVWREANLSCIECLAGHDTP